MALEGQNRSASPNAEPSSMPGSDGSVENPEGQLNWEDLLETRERLAAWREREQLGHRKHPDAAETAADPKGGRTRRALTSRSEYDGELAYWLGFVRRYGLTLALAAICVVVFLVELGRAGVGDPLDILLGEIPTSVVYEMGGLLPQAVTWPYDWYRFIVSNFLHGNALHVFGNVLVLLAAGHLVELGAKKTGFAFVAAASALASSAAAYCYGMQPDVATFVSIGASGIAYGMVGGGLTMLALHREHAKPFGIHCIFLYLCAFYELPSLLLTPLVGGTFEFEHVAGLVAGALAMLAAPSRDLRTPLAVRVVAGAGLVAFFVAFFATRGTFVFG